MADQSQNCVQPFAFPNFALAADDNILSDQFFTAVAGVCLGTTLTFSSNDCQWMFPICAVHSSFSPVWMWSRVAVKDRPRAEVSRPKRSETGLLGQKGESVY